MSNTVQTTNERTDERTKRRVSLCLLCLPGCPSYGGSGLLAMLHRNRNLRGMGEGRNPGLTNKYVKVGRLIIRKIIKITAIRCHILGLNTPNSIHGVCPSVRPCLGWSLTLSAAPPFLSIKRGRHCTLPTCVSPALSLSSSPALVLMSSATDKDAGVAIAQRWVRLESFLPPTTLPEYNVKTGKHHR